MHGLDGGDGPGDELTERILALSARLPETLGALPPPRVEAVVARTAARPRTSSGVDLRGPTAWTQSRHGFRNLLLAAAAVLVVGFPAVVFFSGGREEIGFGVESFSTGASETADLTLRDGTVVKLAPRSRLRLEPSGTERRLSLEGQAFFAVAHDGRPFVVRTPVGEIRVLGTRFDLSARDEDLQLVVVEGRVAVSARGLDTEVRAGQLGRIVRGTPLPVQDVPDPLELTGWVGRFLAFQSTPLAEAARDIEHQYGVRIEITDSTLARRTVTTWFSDWSLEDVLAVVCSIAEAHCSTTDDVVTIEPLHRRAPDHSP
jgi:ferric-dicitrate binding protein FerR (iron transport regulator)